MAVGLRQSPITDYVPARWRWDNARAPRVFCLHVPVFPERMDGAERIAEYFRTTDRKASTHFCTDPDSIIRCIPDGQYGAAARGINADGIHVEMTGMPDQSKAEWLDSYSEETMRRTAELFALYHVEYGIPITFVDAAGLKRGKRGITTHAEAWKAYGGDYRSDPGPHFPMDFFLALCREAVSGQGGFMAVWDYCKMGDGTDKVDRPKVRSWQRILKTMGAYDGKIDGIYGSDMRDAVAEIVSERDGTEIDNRSAHQLMREWIRHEARVAVGNHGSGEIPPHQHPITSAEVVQDYQVIGVTGAPVPIT